MTAFMLADIDQAVAKHFKIDRRDLISHKRERKYTTPRFAAYYLARRWTPQSYPQLGLHYGGRDHTSIMHGERRAIERLAEDNAFAANVDAVENLMHETPKKRERIMATAARGLGRLFMPWPPVDPFETMQQQDLFSGRA